MRVDPSQLQSILDSDKTKARQQAYACQAQIDAVYDVVRIPGPRGRRMTAPGPTSRA